MLSLSEAGWQTEKGVWIWRHLSLAANMGERLAVVGPSGAGKTLLLRALAGLEALAEGTLTFEGRALADWSLPAYRARVMYLPQAPSFVEGSVEENLKLPFGFAAHRDETYDRQAVLGRLDALGRTEGFLRRAVGVLSGGERQIVALLRALQLGPTLLLLDEPTASLDAERTRQVETLLSGWLDAQSEAALVWTSHDAAQVERVTTRRVDLSASGAAPPAATDAAAS